MSEGPSSPNPCGTLLFTILHQEKYTFILRKIFLSLNVLPPTTKHSLQSHREAIHFIFLGMDNVLAGTLAKDFIKTEMH